MVRDKNGILAEVNDENTVKANNPVYSTAVIIGGVSNYNIQSLDLYNALLATKNGKFRENIIKIGTLKQANKILGTDMNGDLVWLDE